MTDMLIHLAEVKTDLVNKKQHILCPFLANSLMNINF